MAKQQTVAKRGVKSTALAKPSMNFEGGAGLENVTARDLLVPRLDILQALSPQVLKNKAEYIKGAEVGDICDLGTGELFEMPLHVLPVHFSKVWIEWAPRESGKGLIRIHDSDEILDQTEREDGRFVLENGNYVVETAQFFVLNLSARGRPSYIAMKSTQLKKARKWCTFADTERVARADGSEFKPHFFYRSYKLGTVGETNAKGDFFGWTIDRDVKLEELEKAEAVYSTAKAFQESIAKGQAKADTSQMRDDVSSEASDERM